MPAESKRQTDGKVRAEDEALRDQIVKELMTESDRGCILVAASVLSHFLEEILKTALSTNPHAMTRAVKPLFGAMAPLSTFSAQIKLAYGLGLIPMYSFSDLEKIRRIRNLAAHQYSNMSFESQEIIDITRTLEGADHAVRVISAPSKVDTNPKANRVKRRRKKVSKERLRFILTVSYIAGYIKGRITRRTQSADPDRDLRDVTK
jgi:DNA-binding MltR family transcriptional regulator